MSRLPPALGLAPMGVRQPQVASKQQQAFEQDTGQAPERLHFVPRESVDATLQGGDLEAGMVICWHPKYPILAVATTSAVAEYDAISGCRRNSVESSGSPVKLRYTSDGANIILLTKERNIVSWSTSTWRRRALLVAEARYADRPLVSGLLAVSAGAAPIVYYSPMGKHTLRTVHLQQPQAAKGSKEKELAPGYKLKTENKKPIVGLAAHPSEPNVVFLLLVDGSLLVCGIGGGQMAVLCGVAVPFDATRERVVVQAVPHPIRPRHALVLVEAERSGLTVLSVPAPNEARILATLNFGAGGALCGTGLLHRSSMLVAAVRHAGGNVGLRAWRLLPGSRDITVLPVSPAPGTVWDALQEASSGSASSLSDVSGEAVLAGMATHGPSALMAFWTMRQDDTGAAHMRVPLLMAVDGEDPLESLGAAKCAPLHTAPSFWTPPTGGDGVVSKLHFPRYTHFINTGRVCTYDLSHGMLADFLVPPAVNSAGQERVLVRSVGSSKQRVWLVFSQLLSAKDGAPLGPGQYEFSAVAESEASVAAGQWWLPGRDGVFVGGRDEMTVVLSNSGTLVAVFETAKLAKPGAKALYVAELKEGVAARLFPGPPSHIPAAPEPRPEVPPPADGDDEDNETDDEAEAALAAWEEKEARRMELPKRMLVLTQTNELKLTDVTQGALSYGAQARTLASKQSLQLRPSEALIQVAWQTLMNPAAGFHAGCPGAATARPCAAAVLTSERVLVVDDKLRVLATAPFPSDVGIPVSCLWLGPALLVSTSTNQVFCMQWEGGIAHMASLLSGPPVTLVGALADRLIVAARGDGPGLLAGRAEVATRGFAVLPPMLVAWSSLGARGILPGGMERARREMRTLLASYDATQVPVAVLDAMAAAGFADVAAAAAARSELPAVTPERKAALAAAAGDWTPLMDLVVAELEASDTFPGPPPKDSALYAKVVAVARACELRGKFTQARALFEAAGAWNELLALCTFQGDFSGLQSYARQAGRDVEGLADQLLAVNENNFRRASASGRALFAGRPNASDWKVETIVEAESDAPKADTAAPGSPHSVGAGVPGDDPGSEGESPGSDVDMDVAPAGRLPFMEASLRVTVADAATGAPPPAEPEDEEDDDAGQPIARLDLNTLEAYLGVAGATVAKSATVLPGTGAAAAPAPLPSLARDDTTASTELAAAAAMLASGTPRTGGDSESVPGSEGDAEAVAAKGKEKDKDVTAAQSAARAAFAKDSTQDEDDFFSSDEESNPADAEARSATSFATSTSNRFMINIRSPEETPRAASGGDTASLRAAVSNLKLGGLPPPSPQASASGAAPNTDRPSEQGTSSARSSVSSMEMFPTLASLPTITTPPPAMPQAEASSEDFFANFGAPTPPPAAAQTAPDATSAAAPAAQAVIKDPFAELPGLPQTLSQAAKTTEPKAPLQSTPSGITPGASEPLPLHAFHSGDATSAPMRPQAPAPLPQSDLLAGWDEFESMFGGGASTPAPAAAASTAPPAIPAPIEPPAIAPVVASSDSAEPPAAVKKLHKKATEAFCKGLWAKAADQYGEILGTVAGTPEAAAFTQQCVFEYAAALLVMRAAAAPPAAASRLARHAASLPIAQEQLAIVTAFAIEANMAAGNYGWAGDQLSGLLVLSAEGQVGGPGLEPKTLQDRLEACDRAGNANADLPGDEDAEIFASIVGSCQGKGDVDELVGDLTRG